MVENKISNETLSKLQLSPKTYCKNKKVDQD